MATRWARSAAIRPMPRSVSSGRSPAVPMMTVIGAAPAGRASGDPLGHVEHGRDPGLVVGEVDDDDPGAEAVQVEPAGRALGGRAEVDEAVAHLGDRWRPRPARAARRGQGVGDVVARQAADRDRDPPTSTIRSRACPVAPRRASRLRTRYGPPAARAMAADDRGSASSGEREERDARAGPGARPRRRADRRALSTTQPSGFVIRQTVDLTSASSGSVWMPWRSRWSDETLVRTLASFDS